MEDDLADDEKVNKNAEGDFKKPKPSRRKLFTHQYGSIDDDSINQTNTPSRSATKIKQTNSDDLKIDIPQFLFKPRKLMEAGSTPSSKELPKPMLDAVTKSLNTKGGYGRVLTNGMEIYLF